MVSVGFTGNRHGLTPKQEVRVAAILMSSKVRGEAHHFHHGDCVGADEEAAAIAKAAGYFLVSHPPDNPKARAYVPSDFAWVEKPYIARNHDIVKKSDKMVACPDGYEEVLRSGTWATIRHARKVGKPLTIVFPDGSTGR